MEGGGVEGGGGRGWSRERGDEASRFGRAGGKEVYKARRDDCGSTMWGEEESGQNERELRNHDNKEQRESGTGERVQQEREWDRRESAGRHPHHRSPASVATSPPTPSTPCLTSGVFGGDPPDANDARNRNDATRASSVDPIPCATLRRSTSRDLAHPSRLNRAEPGDIPGGVPSDAPPDFTCPPPPPRGPGEPPARTR